MRRRTTHTVSLSVGGIWAIVGVLFLLSMFWGAFVNYGTIVVDQNMRITDKETVTSCAGGDCTRTMFVYAVNDQNEEYKEYTNDDSVFHLKYKSRNLQNIMEKGLCYDIKRVGYRVGFLNMYENILEAEKVECKK